MKATALIIILFVMPGLAQKSNLVEEESCSAPSSHFHRHSDLRIAMVEVREHDRCGFNYLDLEEQTVGLDHRMEFAPDFAIAREKANKEDPSELRNVLQTRRPLCLHRPRRAR